LPKLRSEDGGINNLDLLEDFEAIEDLKNLMSEEVPN
jgi:hypothetical protein